MMVLRCLCSRRTPYALAACTSASSSGFSASKIGLSGGAGDSRSDLRLRLDSKFFDVNLEKLSHELDSDRPKRDLFWPLAAMEMSTMCIQHISHTILWRQIILSTVRLIAGALWRLALS